MTFWNTLFAFSEKKTKRPGTEAAPAVYGEPAERDRTDVLSLLDGAPVEIDSLIRETGLPAGTISVLLVELELAGRIERLPGNKVMRITSL